MVMLAVAVLSLLVVGVSLIVPSDDTSASPYYDFEEGGFEYKIIDEVKLEVTVIGCKNTGDVVVPEFVTSGGKTYTITSFGSAGYTPIGNKVTSVTLSNRVSIIEADAFVDAANLVSVSGPSVIHVGDRAFSYCPSLESVDLPNANAIYSGAFVGCVSLKSIYLPNIENIYADAFRNCEGLEYIFLGDSLNYIASKVFWACISLEHISIPANVEEIGMQIFENCDSLRTIDFNGNDKIKSIPAGAFSNCKSLERIDLPNSVETIGEMAFAYCEKLVEVGVGEGSKLTSIGDGAFYENSFSHFTVPKGVTNMSSAAFYRCYNLEAIDVEEGNPKYRSIDGVLYIIGSGPDDLTLSLFPLNKNVSEYTLPDEVVALSDFAFADNAHLVKMVLNDHITVIPDHSFSTCPNLEVVVFGANVKQIGPMAFWGSKSLREAILPDSVEIIDQQAFMRCYSLVDFAIGPNVKSIGQYAFKECTSLKEFTIPDGVTELPSEVFASCTALETLNIGSGLRSFGMGAFNSLFSLKAITLSEDNTAFALEGGVLYSSDYKTLYLYPAMMTGSEYTFNEKTELLKYDAFWGCKYLEKVTLSAALKTIGMHLTLPPFAYCSALECIEVPEGNTSFESIDGVLIGTRFGDLSIIQYPMNKAGTTFDMSVSKFDEISNVCSGAFYGILNLEKIVMPKNLTAFDETIIGCMNLREVIFPDSDFFSLDWTIFDNCPALEHIYVSCVISSSQFEIDGYELEFYTDAARTQKFENYNKLVGDIYISAIGDEYVVTLDANGGTVGSETITVTYGDEYGEIATPVRDGYRFIGWYTEAVGGTLVTADTIVSILGDHTLYAHWDVVEPVPSDDGDEVESAGFSLMICIVAIILIAALIVLILKRNGM